MQQNQIFNLFADKATEAFSFGKRYEGTCLEISKILSTKNLGFHLEVMEPKTFSAPYHWHEKEEELCIVIEGEAILRKNNEFRRVKPGDLLYHGTGPESAHHMYNHTDKAFKFFALSTSFPDEKCGYPDSKKIMDRKSRTIFQEGKEVDYWKDEQDPSIYWPENALRGEVS